MTFEYLTSKDGNKTVKAEGIFLHSAYSPIKEAERFSLNQKCSFTPSVIIITEPCLSYSVQFLKQSFPSAKIGAVRYTDEFKETDSIFDFVFDKNSLWNLKNILLKQFSEDNIFSVLFISWTPSEKVFPEENKQAWSQIKEALETAKTLLVTRQFFEKKWLLNCINFIKYANTFYTLPQNKSPVFIAASGPSLKDNLGTLKKSQKKFVIIALSSAISVLLQNNITPDFCISTDGGYWAGDHLRIITKKKIPLAIAAEALCKKQILKNNPIIPLLYSDGISKKLCKLTSIPFITAERNGTVSGTALELAKSITSGKIYFSGLDLKEQPGFQHTQPNELEANSSCKDFYLNSKEKRIAKSSFKNESLQIYEEWFSAQKNTKNRIIRIISTELKKNSLGEITDITPEHFEKECELYTEEKYFNIKENKRLSETEIHANLKKVLDFVLNECESEEWKKTLFPLDYIAINHKVENEEQKAKLEKENSRLLQKIQKILRDD